MISNRESTAQHSVRLVFTQYSLYFTIFQLMADRILEQNIAGGYQVHY